MRQPNLSILFDSAPYADCQTLRWEPDSRGSPIPLYPFIISVNSVRREAAYLFTQSHRAPEKNRDHRVGGRRTRRPARFTMESNCTVLFPADKGQPPQAAELMRDLENPDVSVKIRALKQIISMLISGEPLPNILMAVIRFCITQEDHQLKKLLMLYWEIVPKYGPGNFLK